MKLWSIPLYRHHKMSISAYAKNQAALAERRLPCFKQRFKDLGHYRQYAGQVTGASHQALTAQTEGPGLYLIVRRGDHQVVAREGRVRG